MSYFQNPFFEEYQGYFYLGGLSGGDALTFPSARADKSRFQHQGRGLVDITSQIQESTTDLTGNDADGNPLDTLTINYAIDPTLKEFATINIDITTAAAAAATTTVLEMVTSLNNDANFAAFFEASVGNLKRALPALGAPLVTQHFVVIRAKRNAENIKFYISNTGSETILRFNFKAGVAELPTYFARHTVANRHNFVDSVSMLIPLTRFATAITAAAAAVVTTVNHGLTTGDTIVVADSNSGVSIDGNQIATVLTADTFSVAVNTGAGAAGTHAVWARRVDANVIANAVNRSGQNMEFTLAGTEQDYQLIRGRASGLYDFTSSTWNGVPLLTEQIVYPAGAQAGDAAKRIIYTYDGANNLIETMEVPHVLVAGDLITP
jgi:inosine-uridine nucleoside N-ribohydrolase